MLLRSRLFRRWSVTVTWTVYVDVSTSRDTDGVSNFLFAERPASVYCTSQERCRVSFGTDSGSSVTRFPSFAMLPNLKAKSVCHAELNREKKGKKKRKRIEHAGYGCFGPAHIQFWRDHPSSPTRNEVLAFAVMAPTNGWEMPSSAPQNCRREAVQAPRGWQRAERTRTGNKAKIKHKKRSC